MPSLQRRTLASVGLLLALIGCTRGAPDESVGRTDGPRHAPEPPYIEGVVTSLEPDRLRIEEVPTDTAGSAKAVAQLTPETRIWRANGARVPATALRVGQWVRAWFTGPVMESYPVQGTAAELIIVGDRAAPPR